MTALARAWQGLGDHDETIAAPLNVLAVSLHHFGRTGEAVACRHGAVKIFTDMALHADAAAVRQRMTTVHSG